MEYVEGCDLGRLDVGARRRRATRIPPWVGAWIIAEAAKGLHYAHEKKDEAGQPLEIVHRDVWPQNILLSFEGAVKIADFGIASARLFGEERASSRASSGTCRPSRRAARRSTGGATSTRSASSSGRSSPGGRSTAGSAARRCSTSCAPGIVEPPSDVRAATSRRSSRRSSMQGARADARRALPDRARAGRGARRAPSSSRSSSTPRRSRRRSRSSSRATPRDRERAAAAAASPRARARRRAHAGRRARSRAASRSRASVRCGGSGPSAPTPVARARSAPSRAVARRGPARGAARRRRHAAPATGSRRPRRCRARTLDQLRAMLDDIAFKRGMRWVWAGDAEARAIAGLDREPVARGDRRGVARARRPRDHRRASRRTCPTPVARVDRHRARHRHAARATRRATSCATCCTTRRRYLADVLGARDAVGTHVGRRRRLSPGAPRLPLGRRADACSSSAARGRRRAADDAHLRARAQPLARGARWPRRRARRAISSAATPRRPSSHAAYHEAVSGGGGARAARVAAPSSARWASARRRSSRRSSPSSRRTRASCASSARPVQMEVPVRAPSPSSCATRSGRPARSRSRRWRRSSRAPAAARRRATRRARWSRASPSWRPTARWAAATRTRTRGKKRIVAGVRNLLAAIALAAAARRRRRGPAVGGQGEPRRRSREIVHAQRPAARSSSLLVTRPDDRVAHAARGRRCASSCAALDAEEQVRLVETRLGVREGARQVCAELLPRVGGNPFFLLEMVDALLERGALEIRETEDDGGERVAVLVRTERADAGFGALPRRWSSSSATASASCPRAEHAVVDWLAIAGGPLPLADLVEARRARADDEAIVRLCARGLCDRKGELDRLPPPAHARRRVLGARRRRRASRMHRDARRAPRARRRSRAGVSAAIVARHLARGESASRAAEFYLEAADAARDELPDAARHPLLPARARRYLPPDDTRRVARHEALESASTACSGGGASACGTSRRCGASSRRIGDAARRVPRAPAHARASTSTRGTSRAGCPSRSARPRSRRVASIAALEVEAEALVSEILRELGDVQGALAACDRALAACDPHGERQRAAALRARGAPLARRAPPPRRPRARGGRRLRRGHRRLPQASARAAQEARAKNALAYAMFVQGRYEDAIALALESIQIDLAIGGRFQIAKTLTNIGHSYFRARRRAARARLPEARARGARALRRSGRPRRHAARRRAIMHRARRRRRRRAATSRDARRAQRRDRQRLRLDARDASSRARARARAARAARRRSTHAARGAPRGGAAGARRVPLLRDGHRGGGARRRGRDARGDAPRDDGARRGGEPAGVRVRPRDPRRSAPTRSSARARRRRRSAHQRAVDYATRPRRHGARRAPRARSSRDAPARRGSLEPTPEPPRHSAADGAAHASATGPEARDEPHDRRLARSRRQAPRSR